MINRKLEAKIRKDYKDGVINDDVFRMMLAGFSRELAEKTIGKIIELGKFKLED